ncbi:MAG: hypothetical protein AAF211_33455, partial [Myxococcota bacterium]
PSRLANAGVDVDDSLSVLFFDDREIVVDVGFQGSEHQASRVVAVLLGLDEATSANLGWHDGDLVVGGRRLPPNIVDVTFARGRLTIRAGVPTTSGATPLRRIVRRDDPGEGCALTFDGALPQGPQAREAGRKATHVTGMVHVPLAEGAPATARFQTGGPVPTALTTSPSPPVGGSTSERPAVLLSIGVSLGDLLLDPAFHHPLELEEPDVIALLSEVRFGRGTTVAFYADDPKLGYVANLDVTRADGRPLGPRRTRRALQHVLRRMEAPHRRVSRTELEVVLGRTRLWLAARDGGLVVGSHRERVLEAAWGRGRPWIESGFAELAARHPVAMRSEGVTAETIPPVAADLGIRTAEGLWELTFGVHVDDDRKEATHSALAATISAIVLPHILPDDAPRH